ncbi:MAG TPA: hypothetical protein DER02_03745 [Gammaproteobacteria bacterium]|nr:hypothetical protein [Gammaproteobacteria bacterium]|tara:strand:- start:1273 stop:1821 length:549 start_codon:yes stop_codon:yes gene_type:complete
MREFILWLDTHEWSTAIHESFFVYPIIESTHVLTLCLFVGTLIMVDLRLLGLGLVNTPVSEVTRRVLPWTLIGAVIMFVTGLLLFYAIPERTYHSLWFRIKVVMLIVAGINALYFHYRVHRNQSFWDNAPKPPLNARVSAAVSLTMWAGVIVTGRMIAYNWFDCDRQPQPEFINWAAGCVLV